MLTEKYVDEVERSTIGILKQLGLMEITWDEKQKEKKKQRLRENIKKRVRAKDFVDQLLVKCKQQEGPLTSVHELRAPVSNNSPDLKTFLRLELQYQRVTHQRDFDVRRNLYKVKNKVSEKEMIENLTVIFGDDHQEEEAVVFPCENEIMEKLTESLPSKLFTQHRTNRRSIQTNHLL
jgi:hypothetical protein